MGSKTKVMSLCGSRLVDDSLQVDRPTCDVCRARIRTARARAREAEEDTRPPEKDRVILLATTIRQAEIWITAHRGLYPDVTFILPDPTRIMGALPWDTYFYRLPHVHGGEIRYGYLLQLCDERGLLEWEPELTQTAGRQNT
jgi:hypothetical protein